MKKFTNLMVDIETFGTSSDAAILSIAAIPFNINNPELGAVFYQTIDLDSSLKKGLKVDASTILWWLNQDAAARNQINLFPKPLDNVLRDFSIFCKKEYQIWGNSARFDLGILESSYKACNLPIPWDFKKERCVRTLASLFPYIKKEMPFDGTRHNPVDDCVHQIKYCREILKEIAHPINGIEVNFDKQ